MPQPPYPLHPSVANRLAGQYVTFYNNFIQHLQQSHYQPIAASRLGGKIIAGSSRSIPVGKIQDLSICRKESTGSDGVPIRCFIPAGEPPSTGWPVMLYFHGGGFVLGGIDTENPVCTNLCMRASSVVITTDYRCVFSFQGILRSDARADSGVQTCARAPFPCSSSRLFRDAAMDNS